MTIQDNMSGFIPVSDAFDSATAPAKSAYLRTDEVGSYRFRLRSSDPVERVFKADYQGLFPPSNRDAWDIIHCVDEDGKDLKIDTKSSALYHLFAPVWAELGIAKSSPDPIDTDHIPLIKWELEVIVASNPQLKKPATLRLTAELPTGKIKSWTI